ncbi:aminoglycoside phosphotransferase family protein [Patescibacteria group bacterium]|nr:aminoglycoside phosphotransferase family protein [Patescibacteria group bacterium]
MAEKKITGAPVIPAVEEAVSSEKEKALDAQMELILVKYAEKINEGNNGVVFLVDFDKVSDDMGVEFGEVLREFGLSIEGTGVVKVLKVYRPGAGKHEFEMQKRAFDIINKTSGSIAKVANPILFRDISLTKATQDFLMNRGLKSAPGRAEIILMDFIPGVDLANYLYRAVVKTHSRLRHLVSAVDQLSFSELHENVGMALGFSDPGGKGKTREAKSIEEEKVYNKNEELLYQYLERKEFRFPRELLDQYNAAINALHENGVCWRDAHQRNFMIEEKEGPSEKSYQGYIIDFGSSTVFEGTEPPQECYLGATKRFIDDRAVIRIMRQFAITKNEKVDVEVERKKQELRKLEERIGKNQRFNLIWKNFLEKIFESAEKDTDILKEGFHQIMQMHVPGGENFKVDLISIFLLKSINLGAATTSSVKNFISNVVTKEQIPISTINKLVFSLKLFQ